MRPKGATRAEDRERARRHLLDAAALYTARRGLRRRTSRILSRALITPASRSTRTSAVSASFLSKFFASSIARFKNTCRHYRRMARYDAQATKHYLIHPSVRDLARSQWFDCSVEEATQLKEGLPRMLSSTHLERIPEPVSETPPARAQSGSASQEHPEMPSFSAGLPSTVPLMG